MNEEAMAVFDTAKYKSIRVKLRGHMKRMGARGAHYEDMVDSYMHLWATKVLLEEDIKDRGVTVPWSNGPNQSGRKKNESVGELVKVAAQMQKLRAEMGVNPAQAGEDSDARL